MGRPILLDSMEIAPRQILHGKGNPKLFKIYASNNSASWTDNQHSSWVEIHNQTTLLSYTVDVLTPFGDFTAITSNYQYFVMVVTNTENIWGYLTFSELTAGS